MSAPFYLLVLSQALPPGLLIPFAGRFLFIAHFRKPGWRPAPALSTPPSKPLEAEDRFFNLLALRAQILQHLIDVHANNPKIKVSWHLRSENGTSYYNR